LRGRGDESVPVVSKPVPNTIFDAFTAHSAATAMPCGVISQMGEYRNVDLILSKALSVLISSTRLSWSRQIAAITVSDTSSTAARRTDALSRTIRKALVMPQHIPPADEMQQDKVRRA
jgi:hypothetical protein